MNTIKPTTSAHHIEIIHLSGNKGEHKYAVRTPFCHFRVREVVATDSLGGKSTKVGLIFVGHLMQSVADKSPDQCHERFMKLSAGILSSDFTVSVTGRDRFDTCQDLIPITISVEFLEDCDWSIELRGEAIKNPDDTRDTLRNRAVDNYRDATLIGSENWTEEHRAKFDEMIASMRNAE